MKLLCGVQIEGNRRRNQPDNSSSLGYFPVCNQPERNLIIFLSGDDSLLLFRPIDYSALLSAIDGLIRFNICIYVVREIDLRKKRHGWKAEV